MIKTEIVVFENDNVVEAMYKFAKGIRISKIDTKFNLLVEESNFVTEFHDIDEDEIGNIMQKIKICMHYNHILKIEALKIERKRIFFKCYHLVWEDVQYGL